MALRFECSLLFAQKVIDTADIVREAIYQQLTRSSASHTLNRSRLHWRTSPNVVGVRTQCHGYVRIIYGPKYTLPENLQRLKSRGLGAKRSLALREFSLGLEALERFVHEEPLRRVHECVFGVLALENEPIDPRCKAASRIAVQPFLSHDPISNR